jgi:hypothetical protein
VCCCIMWCMHTRVLLCGIMCFCVV